MTLSCRWIFHCRALTQLKPLCACVRLFGLYTHTQAAFTAWEKIPFRWQRYANHCSSDCMCVPGWFLMCGSCYRSKFVCRNDFEKIWIQFCVQTGAILPEGRKMGDAKSPTYCSALFESAEYPTCGQPFDMTSLTSVYPIMLFSSCVTLSYKFGIYPELFHSIKRTSRTNFGEPAIRINWID